MVTSEPTAAAQSPDWLVRPFERSRLAPAWLGLGVAFAYPVLVGLVHLLANAGWGPAEVPFGPARFAWTVAVNGALFGVLLAGYAQLHLRAVSDVRALAPLLPGGEAEAERAAREVAELSPRARWGATIGGAAGGLAIATLDPTLRHFYGDVARSDPRYLLFVGQNVVFGVLGTLLFAAEVHMSRAYARLGERVAVDLLDLSKLRVFARKGLRSVVIWVLVSTTFSMFWVLDSAGRANVVLPFLLLVLVVMALVAPTWGAHRSIAAAKEAELAQVAEAIRRERDRALVPGCDGAAQTGRLADWVAYQAFVRSIREWPFDLSIVSRSVLLIGLGAGSWLGGALVERLLDWLLD